MSAKAPLFHRVSEGLVEATSWTAPLEGPYTRIAKLALLNVFDARALSKLLFNQRIVADSYGPVHSRTFLASAWATPGATSHVARSVLNGFLDQLCGRWATRLATDRRLRLCPRCADMGYQSALFQIPAVVACPIHEEPLVDECRHCGEPTPPYALTRDAFDAPMLCKRCGVGYGRAWTGAAELDFWRPPTAMDPLLKLGRRLAVLKHAEIEWPSLSTWQLTPIVDPAGLELKRLVFDALPVTGGNAANEDRKVPAHEQPHAAVSTWPCRPALRAGWQSEGRDHSRRAIYKSICRRVIREYRLRTWLPRSRRESMFHVHRDTQAVVPKHKTCPPALHALAVWSYRFEDCDWSVLRRWAHGSRSISLRQRMLRWPVDRDVDDAAWGHFVWFSFREDLWTAQEWSRLTSPLGDPLNERGSADGGLERRRAAYLDMLRAWTPRMSSLVQAWPSGLSHFVWRTSKGDELFSLVALNRNLGDQHGRIDRLE